MSGSEEVLGVLFIVCSQIEGNGGICLRSGGIAGDIYSFNDFDFV